MNTKLLDNIRIVLVNPLYGGNIGSTCRAMANMGICDLAIAQPRSVNMDEAVMMACHAVDIFKNRTEFPSLAEAVADCGTVIGSTAREGLYRQHVQMPREIAPLILEAAARGTVAIVFGREDKGLTNEELAVCTHLFQIPTTQEFKSLNLSQAVMVMCYEIFIAAGFYEPPAEKSVAASFALKERMFEMWRETLLKIGFMDNERADHMMLGIRRIMGRGAQTEDDVRIMMGINKQTKWAMDPEKDQTVVKNKCSVSSK